MSKGGNMVETPDATEFEIRNEIARREEAGVDARVPMIGPEKLSRFSTTALRAALSQPNEGAAKPVRISNHTQSQGGPRRFLNNIYSVKPNEGEGK